MDPRLYEALKKGNVAYLEKRLLQDGTEFLKAVTAEKNTALHIVAGLGYRKLVMLVSEKLPNLLFAVNSKGDSPLHCAARSGQDFVVINLIGSMKIFNPKFRLTEMQNRDGNTPLHEAAINSHLRVILELMKVDAQLGEVVNKFGESAVYLATERGVGDFKDVAAISHFCCRTS